MRKVFYFVIALCVLAGIMDGAGFAALARAGAHSCVYSDGGENIFVPLPTVNKAAGWRIPGLESRRYTPKTSSLTVDGVEIMQRIFEFAQPQRCEIEVFSTNRLDGTLQIDALSVEYRKLTEYRHHGRIFAYKVNMFESVVQQELHVYIYYDENGDGVFELRCGHPFAPAELRLPEWIKAPLGAGGRG